VFGKKKGDGGRLRNIIVDILIVALSGIKKEDVNSCQM